MVSIFYIALYHFFFGLERLLYSTYKKIMLFGCFSSTIYRPFAERFYINLILKMKKSLLRDIL